MTDQPEGESSEASGLRSVVGGAIDAIGDLITGIPAPIRKNAIKAFVRLCTTGLEYPAVRIEAAIAERRAESAERLAESRARVKLLETSARQLAKQMQTTAEYAGAAAAKFAQKIIRERANIDEIAELAAQELQSEPVNNEPEQPEAPSLSDDWLNVFDNEAAPMTSAQMERLFAKILAGEIRRPQSYSIRTIRLAAQVDNRAAALFSVLCSLSISFRIPGANTIWNAHVVSMGDAGTNSLAPYGLSFDALNILQEYGLIVPNYNVAGDYRISVTHTNADGTPIRSVVPIVYQNAQWIFVPKTPRQITEAFYIIGVGFSHAGKELLPIVDITSNEDYTAALHKFFDAQGMVMVRLPTSDGST